MIVKIKVDFIEDSSIFRQAAITFEKHGYYTAAPKGTTAYKEFWDEETDRCLNGFISDSGIRISGYNYFYLNYSPIVLNRSISYTTKKGNTATKIERVRGFPRFHDYDKTFYDTVEMAEDHGKHLTVLKKRASGYSFKCASMLARNFFLIPESTSLAYASEAEYLIKDGILTKCWDMIDFINEHTAWSKKMQKTNTKMHKRASFIVDKNGVQMEMGYKSEIIGVSLKNDPQKARGKRARLILFEEGGNFPGVKTAWQIARPSVEIGANAFGLMILFGTGGTEGADFEGMREIFYEPEGYNCLQIENIWDDGALDPCGFFVPEYYNMEGTDVNGDPFMDENGNSIIPKAKQYSLEQRKVMESKTTDKTAVDRYAAEHPLTPQEACMQLSGNIFPKQDLIRQLAFIRTHESVKDFKQVGELYFDNAGKIRWEPNPRLRDLTKYHLDRNLDPTGAVVIWEHPIETPPFGLYIAGCLLPGEKVITSSGLKKVEDVTLEDKLINKDGKEVDINTLLRYDKVDEPTFKVHMSNVDRPTIYTQEHPLYLSATIDGEFDFYRVKNIVYTEELRTGLWTKYPNIYIKNKGLLLDLWDKHKSKRGKQIENPLNKEDFWWFVGHWLGDGFNHNQGKNYTIYNSFGKNENEYVDKYKDIVYRIFSRNPHLKLQNGSNTHKFEFKQLYLFLEENFGKYADGKYISEWVKYIPENLKLQLVLGYLDSDGSVFKDRTLIRASFKSINRTLLNDIQDVLFSLGIVSKFNLSDKAGKYNINGKTGKTKEAYLLQVGKIELKKLADKYEKDFNSRKLRAAKEIELLQKARENKSCIISEDNKYIYLKIKKIEPFKYTGTVYNFDCETHTFVSQYCSTHNCDPYDHDKSGTNSLGSVYIYKRFYSFDSTYDILVAEYTGRPSTADDFYEVVRKLAFYYNARVLYENQWPGLHTYFKNKHCDYLLADQPDVISKIIKDSKVTRTKGIHMSKEIKAFGELKLRDWLNEEKAPGKKNLQNIYSEALLEELISYNDEGNFDRVIALMMIIIYKEELYNYRIKQRADNDRSRLLFPDGLHFKRD